MTPAHPRTPLEALTTVLALDLRSLALGRLLLGLTLILDLSFRACDLSAHYSDAGVLPRSAIHPQAWDFSWSLHALSGAVEVQALLFGVSFLAALGLTLGYRTELSAAACWLLSTSLHGRNPLLRDGQDDLFRVVLFFAMLLPLGAVGSLDARHGRGRSLLGISKQAGTMAYATPASAAYLLQMAVVYWAGAITKLQSPWWTSGKAVYYALSLSRYQTNAALLLLDAPGLLEIFGWAVTIADAVLPCLLFVPFANATLRKLVIAGFAAMHLGFFMCMRLGVFPLLSIASCLLFLPSSVWERFPRARIADPGSATVTPLGRVVAWSCAGMAVIGALVMLIFNAPALGRSQHVPRPIALLGVSLGLQQYWDMFAPNPITPLVMTDGWYAVPGTLASGEVVSVAGDDETLPWSRPRLGSALVENHRWRQYLANLRITWPAGSDRRHTVDTSRAAYAEWLCRRWNQRHDAARQVLGLELIYVKQPLGEPDAPVTRVNLLQHRCGGS